MKVLLVSREYPPESPGGLGNATRNLALGLLTQGVTPVVLSSAGRGEGSGAGSELPGGLSIGEHDGIEVVRAVPNFFRLSREPRWFWRLHDLYYPLDCHTYSRLIARACKEIVEGEKIDVIQFPDFRGEGFHFIREHPEFPTVIRLATPYYIVERINLRGRRESPGLWNRMAWNLMRFIETRAIREARALASPSTSLADIVRREARPRGTIRIIHTGIDTDHFSRRSGGDLDRYRAELGIDSGPVVLFTGRYEYRKGLQTLFAAFAEITKRHPRCTLVTAGGDTETAPDGGSMKAYLEETAERLGIGSNLVMLDRVSYGDLPLLYSLADLFVAPSIYENFANTLLEAMACGVPLVSTSAGGAPEIIDDRVNGRLVPPESPRALSEAILELLRDENGLQEMGRRNVTKARKLFSREAMAKGFVELYRELI